MLLEICLVENIVNEACNIRYTCLVSLRIWTVKGKVELEVRELLLDLIVVIEVEGLLGDNLRSEVVRCGAKRKLPGWVVLKRTSHSGS